MRIEGVLFWVFPHRGECEFREKNILGKSCTTFVIVKIVRNLSRGRSPCQRVNHVKSGVIYFSAFIYSCIRYYSYMEPGPNNSEGPPRAVAGRQRCGWQPGDNANGSRACR